MPTTAGLQPGVQARALRMVSSSHWLAGYWQRDDTWRIVIWSEYLAE